MLLVHRRTYGTPKGHVGPGITFICWCVAFRRVGHGAALPHASGELLAGCHTCYWLANIFYTAIHTDRSFDTHRRGTWWTVWVLWTYLRGGSDHFRARSWYGPKKVGWCVTDLFILSCKEFSNRNRRLCIPMAASGYAGRRPLAAPSCLPLPLKFSGMRKGHAKVSQLLSCKKYPYSWCCRLLNERLGSLLSAAHVGPAVL